MAVNQKIIVIVGPTSSGKSALAVRLAKRFNGEIISADSRQVYRGLNLGTGKITKKEMAGVPHHLLDVASPKTIFTAARFEKLAVAAIKKISARGRVPIVAGGTAFYIDTLLGRAQLAPVPPNHKLRQKLKKLSLPALFEKLKKLDPRRAQNIDRCNRRRLERALEIALSPHLSPKNKFPKYQGLILGLRVPSKILRQKITARLNQRWHQGLGAEVRRLQKQGLSWKRLDDLGLEYRWVAKYLKGELSKEAVLKKLETEIWRYAKRQLTWWKRNPEIVWLESPTAAPRLVKDFLSLMNAKKN